MRTIFISLINFYQRTWSPDHSPRAARYPAGFCRFYPSCSEYTKIAIEQQGSARGIWLGIRRISRCTPWAKPAVDLSCYTHPEAHHV